MEALEQAEVPSGRSTSEPVSESRGIRGGLTTWPSRLPIQAQTDQEVDVTLDGDRRL